MRILILISIFLGASVVAQENDSGLMREMKIQGQSYMIDSGGDSVKYEFGTILVPENRQKPESRIIEVGFMRIFAKEESVTAPIFCLPGGPGSSMIGYFSESVKTWRWIDRFDSFLDFADVVIVDQRGYSPLGNSMLMGSYKQPARPKDRPFTIGEKVDQYGAFAKQSVSKYEENKIDLSAYTVIECSNDVKDLRKALGYNKISLYGGSFGSQWSFAIMRLYPEIVERAILSGVEPLNHGYDMPSHVFAAVRRMWTFIDSDPNFKPHLPEGGMAEAAKVVMERLQESPLVLNNKIVLGPEDFPWNQPALILWMYHKNLDKLVSVWKKRAKKQKYYVPLIGPLIDISLGVTPEREAALKSDTALVYIGQSNFAEYMGTAEIWPSEDIGDELRNPIECEIPVLFVQGDWDTSTPIENTFEIAPYFVNSHVLVVERGGHVVFDDIRREFSSVWGGVNNFLRTGEFDGLPERIRLKEHRTFRNP